jgi:hypothetical protein
MDPPFSFKQGNVNSSASSGLSLVIPAVFKRESSGAQGWIPAKKPAGMTGRSIREYGNTGIREYGNTGIREYGVYGVYGNNG